MPVDEDKYPVESDRRRFVKGVVGGATLAGITTAGSAAVNSATAPSGQGGGTTTFRAVENTDGPAPRGMPQIPIELEPIDGEDDYYIKGVWPEVSTETQQGREVKVAKQDIAGVTYSSEWFQYCGVQTYTGVYPDAQEENSDLTNYFRYTESSQYEWQSSEVSGGDRMKLSDFEDYETWENGVGTPGIGKPATGTWRSEGLEPAETMPVEIIRSKRIEQMAKENPDSWLAASTDQGVMAHLNKCTHFCCVPGFKKEGSAKFAAADAIYCQCHQSVYDPFNIVEKSFVALPRPSKE
ncbi:ubiquinol-cytochrome c reductase iron-sulfur subunit [Haloarchaeobius sp. HME9146]|uniref:ubiquinol-cytochrome c reductase iron-sulfur subunit n=1 Tax=Haloarchaeobius sp. HME9146 TaxID=2978732 RepID=UPI0021BF5509|nr:ubiquinol-cytochrome c reductase iron-sulfur subunit [Haloarchaeobius sp. HME9146]MCT9096169.1 ubiquinol-cytochrome c reductase iron-sulfur subunit [Haloarchaeobius sp. HME9146]